MEVSTEPAPPSAPIGDTVPPVDATHQCAELLAKILSRIQHQSRPAPLPQSWSFLGISQSMRQLRGDAAELIASLQTEFSLEELLAAQVIRHTADNQLRLSPIFGDASASFVLRRDAARSAVDVISSRGLLSSAGPDWLRLAAERADGSTGYERPMLLAFEDADVLVLHRLSYKFTSAAQLERLNGNQVRELIAARGRHRQQRRYTLTVPGWQIAECIEEPAPKILKAIERVAQIHSLFHYDPAAAFDVWMPTHQDFQVIRTACSFRDREIVRRAMSNSLEKSRCTPAAALRMIRDRAEIGYGTARRRLIEGIESSRIAPHCGEVGVAFARHRAAFDTAVVNGLSNSGAAINDPWELVRSYMGADLANCWYETLDEVADARKIIAGEYPDRQDSDERFEKKLRLVDRLAKLHAIGRSR